jgi:beta-lactamase superfamily II metal-dependent hydrolase
VGIVRFLNVKEGDCSVIQHTTGRVSVIDVCNARPLGTVTLDEAIARIRGNFNQKNYTVNPVSYLSDRGIHNVFRFILTHPDMDHTDGLKAFCEAYPPTNFWDTANNKEIDFGGSSYNEADWIYYKKVRDGLAGDNPKRLVLYSDAKGQYYNQGETTAERGDGLHILAPTRELIAAANSSDDFNDAGYVILYRSAGGRVLFAGDSHDSTWEHILQHHVDDIRDVDLLIAPHHGRKSGRSFKFLDVVNPGVTLFGCADSGYLAYGPWSYRKLRVITNNQAGCVVIDTDVKPMAIYATNSDLAEAWSRDQRTATFYSPNHQGYWVGTVPSRDNSSVLKGLVSSR